MASHWQHCFQFEWPAISTSDFPLQRRQRWCWTNWPAGCNSSTWAAFLLLPFSPTSPFLPISLSYWKSFPENLPYAVFTIPSMAACVDVELPSQTGTLIVWRCWQFVVRTENETAKTNNKKLTIFSGLRYTVLCCSRITDTVCCFCVKF